MIFHLVAFLIQELPGAVRRLLDPVPSHEERGAENMLYLRQADGHQAFGQATRDLNAELRAEGLPFANDAPDLPIPLLSQDEARRMAEEDTPDA